MRMKIFVLVVLAALVGGSLAPISAQSLAEVARQEEARRRTIRTPAKVITNSDLKPVPIPSPPPAPPAAAPSPAAAPAGAEAAPAAPAGGAEAPAGEVRDQAYWSGRMTGLQTQLSQNQAFAEALQSQIDGLWRDFTSRDDPGQRAVIETNRNRALGELERVKKAIADGQQAITDLQEEARRAGVPPGWLR
jgi:hypothetical protein